MGPRPADGILLMASTSFITAQRSADQLNLTLQGEWRATLSESIEAELAAIDLTGARSARLDAGGLKPGSVARLAAA